MNLGAVAVEKLRARARSADSHRVRRAGGRWPSGSLSLAGTALALTACAEGVFRMVRVVSYPSPMHAVTAFVIWSTLPVVTNTASVLRFTRSLK